MTLALESGLGSRLSQSLQHGLMGAALLRSKVEKGGQGVWGAVPMPAMAYLPADDLQALVNWVVKLP